MHFSWFGLVYPFMWLSLSSAQPISSRVSFFPLPFCGPSLLMSGINDPSFTNSINYAQISPRFAVASCCHCVQALPNTLVVCNRLARSEKRGIPGGPPTKNRTTRTKETMTRRQLEHFSVSKVIIFVVVLAEEAHFAHLNPSWIQENQRVRFVQKACLLTDISDTPLQPVYRTGPPSKCKQHVPIQQPFVYSWKATFSETGA